MAAVITTSASPESKTEEKVLKEVFAGTRVANDVMDALLKKLSDGKLPRVSAWVARFLRNARKHKGDRVLGPL